MYIIDRNKDYYDFHSHIYGIDKKVIYDRRGSTKITNSELIRLSLYGLSIPEKAYILLEIGFVQYLILITNIEKRDTFIETTYSGDMEIVREFRDFKHRYSTPISVRGVYLPFRFKWSKQIKYCENFEELIAKELYEIENPILADTNITSLIDSNAIWQELQNYISSLNNDKDIDLPMSDVEKAEIHGFDKKTSFRNPIK
jgi:hypothetical protein